MLQRVVVPGERDYAQLAKPGAPQGLVVAPTRELASQVSADITTAAARRHARVLTVYGGVGYDVSWRRSAAASTSWWVRRGGCSTSPIAVRWI